MNDEGSLSDRLATKRWLLYAVLFGGVIVMLGAVLFAPYFTRDARARRMLESSYFKMLSKRIQELPLPAEQKRQMEMSVERMRADRPETAEQARAYHAEFDGVWLAIELVKIEEGLVRPSQLSGMEKQEGARALQRLARGVLDYKGSVEDKRVNVNTVGFQILSGGKDGKPLFDRDGKMKVHVSEDDLRRTLQKTAKMADEAGVPNENYWFHFADELDMAIARAKSVSTTGQYPK